ncbi:hypothetical protein DFH06DRAFT_1167477 [Mycena polygramma]|nr:hypothetical protein DFH06DRAFT_1167477 [Mycena polygramma]
MRPELELTVTITYEGPKARITTAEEAITVVKKDLAPLGIPPCKTASISVVYPGTVRFFWIALQHSTIHKNLLDCIRPINDLEAHRQLLNRLSIQSIDLRETPAPVQPAVDYASNNRGSWGRNEPFRIKAEQTDVPIPPPPHRTRYDADDDMEIDSPRKPYTLKRDRYKSIPDFGAHESSEVQGLRRELRDVRQQLSADIAQERALIENLRDLGAEVPEADSDLDFVTKARIEQFEKELQAERARRRRLEEIVEDVRRECTAPFVVPALLDAFVEISKLTNEVMEEG